MAAWGCRLFVSGPPDSRVPLRRRAKRSASSSRSMATGSGAARPTRSCAGHSAMSHARSARLGGATAMNQTWLACCSSAPVDAVAATAVRSRDDTDDGLLAAWSRPNSRFRVPSRWIPAPSTRAAGRPGCRSSLLRRGSGCSSTTLRSHAPFGRCWRGPRSTSCPPSSWATTASWGPSALCTTTIRLGDDPFALLFPPMLIHVSSGLLGTTPTPVGPGIQRYGAKNPWPSDAFPLPDTSDG